MKVLSQNVIVIVIEKLIENVIVIIIDLWMTKVIVIVIAIGIQMASIIVIVIVINKSNLTHLLRSHAYDELKSIYVSLSYRSRFVTKYRQ